MAEVAEHISAAIGKPVRYVDVLPRDYLAANLAAGMPEFIAEALVELYAERRAGKESNVSTQTDKLLGRPPRSFQAFAKRHASVFRGDLP
jgi:uncharacterized protein YbjT (DUF2867 family)